MVESSGAGIGGGGGGGGGLGGRLVPTCSQTVSLGIVRGGGIYVSGFLRCAVRDERWQFAWGSESQTWESGSPKYGNRAVPNMRIG